MNLKSTFIFLLFFSVINPVKSQLKFIIDDFEGFANGSSDLKINGVFTFGNCSADIEHKSTAQYSETEPDYLGDRYITIKKEGKGFSGWGKGIGLNIQLDSEQDYLNFYINQSGLNSNATIRIELQEDDNDDKIFEKEYDDEWFSLYEINPSSKPIWKLVSIPLSKFSDGNLGGDGEFNVGYKSGKLLCFLISFKEPVQTIVTKENWSFDFICFSKGTLPVNLNSTNLQDNCSLGLWSKEGNLANFIEIATNFEKLFKEDSKKKPAVVHFFQPFAVDGSDMQNHYPSPEKINNIIQQGYVPMITLENHYVNTDSKIKQPNLYSIIEGHMDNFFSNWAKQIKQVQGIVLVRILHEFNGDWYPWCISNNDKNPELLIKAFRKIHDIFKSQQVTNVKFIWCPNSMSTPQEKWNFIMDAYPGDDYVDYIGMDIYNGAGQKKPIWRSFRKEGIENYFILNQELPNKPLFVCETASRERESSEPKTAQTKSEWIMQMSCSLKTDMSKIKLLIWFNEKSTFKINSSDESKNAFLKFILKDNYFTSETKPLYSLLNK